MWPVILWWAVLECLGLIAFPLLFVCFGRASVYGYAFAKIAALLLIAYTAWLAAYVIPLSVALPTSVATLTAIGFFFAWYKRDAITAWLRSGGGRQILFVDLLWTAGFLFFVWHRATTPDIFGAEKFMDFAFLNSLAHTNSMPPPDPWMAGETLNYYYFGYLMFADLMRLVPLPMAVSYNLCVATVGGLACAETGAIVRACGGRRTMALLGSAMAVLLGNLDGFLQWVERGHLTGMDIWRSSRVVGRFLSNGRDATTINEFPFFSTIHGDMHPHFMVLPVTLLLLGLLLDEHLFRPRPPNEPDTSWRPWLPFLLVSFVLGAAVAISTWELPVGMLLIAALAGRHQPLWPLLSRQRLILVLRVGIVLVLVRWGWFLPHTLGVHLAPAGVGHQLAHSSLLEFLTVFGLLLFPPLLLIATLSTRLLPGGREQRHLALAAAVLVLMVTAMAGNAVLPLLLLLVAGALAASYAGNGESDRRLTLLIVIAGAALAACEVVYIKDAYGARLYRMNTVFKFYFQAWMILAVAAPLCLQRLLAYPWKYATTRPLITVSTACLVAASACYPLGVTLDRSGPHRRTLNGNAYLQRDHPDDFAVIEWLRAHATGGEVVLEASGNPYSYFARISSNTGLPTIMGWANHEGLWRPGDDSVRRRQTEVTRIYQANTLAEIVPLLDRYHVRYIVAGEIEQRLYAAGLRKFAPLETVFRHGNAVVYRR